MNKLVIAIVGLGYWGPNWLRNFAALEDCTVKYGCDLNAARLKKFKALYPSIDFIESSETVLKDADVDAVVIATPTSAHYPLAKAALEAGKHVLLEKPMAGSSTEAKELKELADSKKKVIVVDHTFAYTASVKKIRELVEQKKLGELLYFDSTRINLGLIQKDTNVLWDLAIHDLTILGQIVDLSTVMEVYATGTAHYGKHIEVGHMHLQFPHNFAAHIAVSWLSPVKIRQTIIGGTKGMVTYDDTQPSEKIRVYDKAVERDDTKADPFFPKYRSGDLVIPALPNTEALEAEAKHFLACIAGAEQPRTSAIDGYALVKLLELADQSLQSHSPVQVVRL